jgi:hypothetical protein
MQLYLRETLRVFRYLHLSAIRGVIKANSLIRFEAVAINGVAGFPTFLDFPKSLMVFQILCQTYYSSMTNPRRN